MQEIIAGFQKYSTELDKLDSIGFHWMHLISIGLEAFGTFESGDPLTKMHQ